MWQQTFFKKPLKPMFFVNVTVLDFKIKKIDFLALYIEIDKRL